MTLVPELEQGLAVVDRVIIVGSAASGVCEQGVLLEEECVLLPDEHLQRVAVTAPATAEVTDEVQPWERGKPVF